MAFPLDKGPVQWFVAKFETHVRFPSPGVRAAARLQLFAEGRPPQSHDVMSLAKPYISDGCCVLETIGKPPDASYRLQLRDEDFTQLFADSLHGLQSFIAKHLRQDLAQLDQRTSSSTANRHAGSSTCVAKTEDTLRQRILATSGMRPSSPGGGTIGSPPQTYSLIDLTEDLPSESTEDAAISGWTHQIIELLGQLTKKLVARPRQEDQLEPVLKAIDSCLDSDKGLEFQDKCLFKTRLSNLLQLTLQFEKRKHPEVDQSAGSVRDKHQSGVPESMKEMMKPIKYSSETLKRFKSRGMVPSGAELRSACAGENAAGTDSGWKSQVWIQKGRTKSSDEANRHGASATGANCVSINGLGSSIYGSSQPKGSSSEAHNYPDDQPVERVVPPPASNRKPGLKSSIYAI
jgi:hypothetical protein